jgi:hypothetical protein
MIIRIGNFEIQKTTYLLDNTENTYPSFDIVVWRRNSHYNRESEYIKDGDYYTKKDLGIRIHKSCFENPEYCYSLARFVWEYDEYVLQYVGSRPLELTESEKKIFDQLIKFGFDHIPFGEYE